jgi:hydroxymethylglutaryl-CoA synthase
VIDNWHDESSLVKVTETMTMKGTSTSTNGCAIDDGKNVGILGLEVYMPATYITQTSLEEHNGVASGKYTIGLGQTAMGVVAGDAEDINSICLTVVHSLLEKYDIDPKTQVGRLEVGTETLVDKSKSTKTVLMQLFEGNTDMEGATVVNACYGGTAALLNAFQWVESAAWDGRYAIVVSGDIAAYAAGPARPTCGCGAVAVLVGRDAPLAFIDPRKRVTHASHTYDFYKPDHSVEYPTVDGALSQSCYYRALEDCYGRFCQKMEKLDSGADEKGKKITTFNAATPDYFVFHAPYNKLVQKSFARLFLMDERRKLELLRQEHAHERQQPQQSGEGESSASENENKKEEDATNSSTNISEAEATFLETSPLGKWLCNSDQDEWEQATYSDRALDGVLKKMAAPLYEEKLTDSNHVSTLVGNTYTASVFLGLASLVASGKLSSKDKAHEHQTLCVFSYGSGAMATMYQLTVRTPNDTTSPFTMERMAKALSLPERLAARECVAAAELDCALETRAKMHSTSVADLPYQPTYPTKSHLWPGTYYLKEMDAKWRRFYERVPLTDTSRSDRLRAAAANDGTPFQPLAPKEAVVWAKQALAKASASAETIDTDGTLPVVKGNTKLSLVITGVSAGLPGLNRPVFSPDNLDRLVRGEQCIEPVSIELKQSMVEKNVVQLKKHKDGSTTSIVKIPIDEPHKVIQLAAQLSNTIDLVGRYGVPRGLAETMDVAAQVAVAAGLEALHAAGLVRGQSSDPSEWKIAATYKDDTGVVYASSFPAMDAAVGEVMRFLQSKSVCQASSLTLVEALKTRMSANTSLTQEDEAVFQQLTQRIQNGNADDDNDGVTTEATPYQFDRKFLFRVLVLGNAQLAQLTGCRGPNTQTNAACAGTTQAIAMAQDMIVAGRAKRVVVIAGDNGSGSTLLPWLGSGFNALGAATTAANVEDAALPFDLRRSGMLLGAGGIGMVLETEESAQQRQVLIQARLLATQYSNSAFHGAALDRHHIAQELERFLMTVQDQYGITKSQLVQEAVYLSHETCTHASSASSCAGNEVAALRKVFGDDLLSQLLILNTKGFTGHPMGVSFEDVAAVQILLTQQAPPIVNHQVKDEYLGDLKLSKGGPYKCKYALRFAAGFGSQVAFALYATKKD